MTALMFYYAALFISIPLYYKKIRKIRQPFSRWGSYKDNVSFGERMCVSFFIMIPVFIKYFVL